MKKIVSENKAQAENEISKIETYLIPAVGRLSENYLTLNIGILTQGVIIDLLDGGEATRAKLVRHLDAELESVKSPGLRRAISANTRRWTLLEDSEILNSQSLATIRLQRDLLQFIEVTNGKGIMSDIRKEVIRESHKRYLTDKEEIHLHELHNALCEALNALGGNLHNLRFDINQWFSVNKNEFSINDINYKLFTKTPTK